MACGGCRKSSRAPRTRISRSVGKTKATKPGLAKQRKVLRGIRRAGS